MGGDSWESIVGSAILGGDRSEALRRVSIKSAVCSRMVCRCGAVLDQRSAVLVHVGDADTDGPAVAVLCPDCWSGADSSALQRASDAAQAEHGAPLYALTWDSADRIGGVE